MNARYLLGAWIVVGFSVGPAQAKVEIPLPDEVTEARSLLDRVEKSETLPKEAKSRVRENYEFVEAQFRQVWKPLTDTFQSRLDKAKEIAAVMPALIEQRRNGEVTDEKFEQTRARFETELKALDTQLATHKRNVEKWLAGPSVKRFNAVADGLLSGRIAFFKGRAWNDLLNAARAQGLYQEPFDTPAPNQDPNVVDGRP
jgi:hypothetical protein